MIGKILVWILVLWSISELVRFILDLAVSLLEEEE